MKQLDFRMERPNLVKVGDCVEVSARDLQTLQGLMYCYTIEPAVGMSGNIPISNKINNLNGTVSKIEDGPSYWTVTVDFDD
ncbi:hypothetical protein C8E03_101680 [Lachnotalea glycerini]|uniref:Uncharacterized protein n=1 Tax=Lachnotalea glycerini TaxID=1763509 RepID=A0A255IP99_9FIRM|nr:hypothetical protein [Lachnotalea glycerini]PXV96047.1 hypothetical protein C8E03_101680 [Lachnotalea glycerini]RDY30581.1 hypothetical protein CG710_013970 [Lachnotalea glycerini]